MTGGHSDPNRESENLPRSRWDTLVWPRWLPSRARLPLIAQIAGAFFLVAAVAMPQWSYPDTAHTPTFTSPAGAAAASDATGAPAAPEEPAVAARPAHLNLDLRHSFRSVDLTVTVDGKRALETKLEGSGKKFGVFGRREDRSFTRTLDLQPGARVVRLRVKSADEKFEHTRVERFDLGPASVATMRVDIEKAGLSVMADRPAPPPAASGPVPARAATATALTPADASGAAQAAARAAQEAQKASALAALYQTLRSTMIALAGFIASVASGFLFEEYLKSRNLSPFSQGALPPGAAGRPARRRRERPPRSANKSDIGIDVGLS